jgi:predicted nucleic acid-binding protein
MRKLLFDASVYIQGWREKQFDLFTYRAREKTFLYFSSVVGSELLRGARDRLFRNTCEELWQDFTKAKRLAVPTDRDWHDAGVALARISSKYGYETIGQTRLVHDTLIALSVRRLGISVVTLNLADFQRIAEFRPFTLLSPADLAHK